MNFHRLLEFRDSFLYHSNCVVIPEKDVLETDIGGVGCITALRRWWNDLFLLSSTFEITRSFYASSHAMAIERFRQFRNFPNRIHPMSKFRYFWDCLILHVFLLKLFIFRLTSTYVYDNFPMELYYFGAVLEIFVITDIYVNLKTGYIDFEAKRVVLDTDLSLNNFCCKKLFIHVASAMPLHWLLFLRFGSRITCGMCKINRFTCVLKLINTFSVYRLYETSGYWTQKNRSQGRLMFFRFFRIGVLAIYTLSHLSDLREVISLLVFIRTAHVVPGAHVARLALLRYNEIIKKYFGDAQTNSNFLIYNFGMMMRLLFSPQIGNQSKKYYLDKITEILALILATVYFSWSLIECYKLVHSTTFSEKCSMNLRENTLNTIYSLNLSDKLRRKVDLYFSFKPARYMATESKNLLFKSLPEILKQEVKTECYMRLVMRIPFFTDWPLSVLEQLVATLRKGVFFENDVVVDVLVEGDGLMIVEYGILAVYSPHFREQGHLIDGDYFGELSLVTDSELCLSFVVAITPCTILKLNKVAFRRCMRQYPVLFNELKAKMKDRFKSRDRVHRRLHSSESSHKTSN